MKGILFSCLFLLLWVADGAAQWTPIPNLVLPGTNGAIHYCSGTLWVGDRNLFYSTDEGVNWQQVSFSDLSGITDISFLNADTGIVSTLTDIYQTFDRGLTWRSIGPVQWQWMRASYDRSSSTILGMASGNLYSSVDGGKNWISRSGTKYNLTFALDRYGAIFFPDAKSTDLGKTWTPLGSLPPSSTDAWSMDIDSCDNRRMVVAVDNYYTNADGMSRMVTTSDGGITWVATSQRKKPWLTGSFAVGPHTMFAGTDGAGIIRSTDAGATWKNTAIGPMGTVPDSRSIAVLSDNKVFVIAEDGRIWKTINSGGDSIRSNSPAVTGPFELSTHTLFTNDSLIACGNDSLARIVTASGSGCSSPVIATITIIGSHASSYHAWLLSSGLVRVVFQPATSGAQPANLVLLMSDGELDTVTLVASAFAGKRLTLATTNVIADTVGADVEVLFTITGAPDPTTVEFVLRYSNALDYLGTFAADGTKLDLPGEQWSGGSRLRMQTVVGGTAGYARFRVYADSNTSLSAVFDSLELPEIPNARCDYAKDGATSKIQAPSGCGLPLISRFLRTGSTPRFSISPNPSNGHVSILSTDNIDNATIEIFDMLGAKQFERAANFESNHPLMIDKNLASGIYNIRIRSMNGRLDRLLIVRN